MIHWPEVRINNWQEFINALEPLKLERDFFTPWAFRGQPDSSWTLKSSITRLLDSHTIGRELGNRFEMTVFREFISKAHLFDDFKIKNFEKGNAIINLTFMQHYGCPTRLIDWTTSPYVALYFAVNSIFSSDGAIFIFNESILNDVNKDDNIDFENILTIETESNHIQAIMSNFNSRRLNSQQGIFTIAANIEKDHYNLIYNSLVGKNLANHTCFFKIIIPKELKHEFLARLRSLNLRADQLFPDLYGFASSLKDLLEIRGWEKRLKE